MPNRSLQNHFPTTGKVGVHGDESSEISDQAFHEPVTLGMVRTADLRLNAPLQSPIFESPTFEDFRMIRDHDSSVVENFLVQHTFNGSCIVPSSSCHGKSRAEVNRHKKSLSFRTVTTGFSELRKIYVHCVHWWNIVAPKTETIRFHPELGLVHLAWEAGLDEFGDL